MFTDSTLGSLFPFRQKAWKYSIASWCSNYARIERQVSLADSNGVVRVSFSPHIGQDGGPPSNPFRMNCRNRCYILDSGDFLLECPCHTRHIVWLSGSQPWKTSVPFTKEFKKNWKTCSSSRTGHSYGENDCCQTFEDVVFDIWQHSQDDLNEAPKYLLLWARSVVVVLSRMFGKTENANVQIAIWSELREESEKSCTGFLKRSECVIAFCNQCFILRFVSALKHH